MQLPPNYHGKQKPFRKLSEVVAEKSRERENPEYVERTVSNWMVKRFDKDVIRERREFLVHPAKISQDTPDWFKTTLHHFHRSNYGVRAKLNRSEEQAFNVFNQKRVNPFSASETTGF